MNVVEKPVEDWSAPAREWISGSGCDAILFHTYTETPLGYAGTWNRPLSSAQPGPYEAALDRWVNHFQRSGITAIAAGGLVLRPRKGANWVETFDVPTARDPGCGEHIHQMMEAKDWLSDPIFEDDLLKAVFRPADDVKLERIQTVRDGRMGSPEIWASKTGGFRFKSDIDEGAWRLINLCDGRTAVAEIVEKLCQEDRRPPEEVRSRALQIVANLYGFAYLTRVS